MSDQNKYVNAYIDSAVGMLHENLNSVIQLKTEIKVATGIIAEKDGIIGNLTSQIESISSDNESLSVLQEKVKELNATNIALSAKTSHIDTFMNQISSMKKELIDKQAKINALENELDQIKNPPKKSKLNRNKSLLLPTTESIIKKVVDDF